MVVGMNGFIHPFCIPIVIVCYLYLPQNSKGVEDNATQHRHSRYIPIYRIDFYNS